MIDLLKALLLGVIEGITEFLPISSTGHLLIAERWLGHRSDLFNIGIQAGAILAVVLIYRQRLWDLAMGFFGRGAPAGRDPAGMALSPAQARDYMLKLAVAFGATAILGIALKKLDTLASLFGITQIFGWTIKPFELPEAVIPVAWALILGGIWMVVAEYFATKRAQTLGERSEISWTVAVLVGIAQVVAGVFPGTSRSAATIFVALLAGTTNPAAATDFAFMVGIPTMFAATGYELIDVLQSGQAANEDWAAFTVAFIASAVTAFIAVKWLLSYIQSQRFTAFAIYRFILGAVLLLMVPAGS